MTTTTRKAPTSGLLGQAKAGAGMALLGASAVVLFWVGSVGVFRMLNTGPMPVALDPSGGAVWERDGFWTDTTTAWDATAGTYHIAWEASCPVKVTLDAWDGTSVTREVVLGISRVRSLTLPIPAGGYFFDVSAHCDWTIRVSRT